MAPDCSQFWISAGGGECENLFHLEPKWLRKQSSCLEVLSF